MCSLSRLKCARIECTLARHARLFKLTFQETLQLFSLFIPGKKKTGKITYKIPNPIWLRLSKWRIFPKLKLHYRYTYNVDHQKFQFSQNKQTPTKIPPKHSKILKIINDIRNLYLFYFFPSLSLYLWYERCVSVHHARTSRLNLEYIYSKHRMRVMKP